MKNTNRANKKFAIVTAAAIMLTMGMTACGNSESKDSAKTTSVAVSEVKADDMADTVNTDKTEPETTEAPANEETPAEAETTTTVAEEPAPEETTTVAEETPAETTDSDSLINSENHPEWDNIGFDEFKENNPSDEEIVEFTFYKGVQAMKTRDPESMLWYTKILDTMGAMGYPIIGDTMERSIEEYNKNEMDRFNLLSDFDLSEDGKYELVSIEPVPENEEDEFTFDMECYRKGYKGMRTSIVDRAYYVNYKSVVNGEVVESTIPVIHVPTYDDTWESDIWHIDTDFYKSVVQRMDNIKNMDHSTEIKWS